MEGEFDRGGVEPIVDASEDEPLYLLFYDANLEDEPHVHMPDPHADEPYEHWPTEKQPGSSAAE